MKKFLTATLLVLVGLTLTGCTVLNKKLTNKIEQTQEQVKEDIQIKIADILKLNEPKECTYTVTEGKNSTIGTMYISGKNIANTVKVTGETSQELNYIMSGDWIYSWGSGNIPAMKMQLSELAKIKPQGSSTEPVDYKNLGMTADMGLECKEWKVDETKFIPPTSIKFTDVTQTMKNFTEKLQQTTTKVKDITSNKCAACNMAPDENTKKECLASLGCN